MEDSAHTVGETLKSPDLRGLKGPLTYLNGNKDGQHYLALGCRAELVLWPDDHDVLARIDEFVHDRGEWIFGYFSYDLKNHLERLSTSVLASMEIPVVHLFVPESIVYWNTEGYKYYGDALREKEVLSLFKNLTILPSTSVELGSLEALQSRGDYLKALHSLKQHIQQGDIYEVNYCQEFGAQAIIEEPFDLYLRLNSLTRAPFSAFLRLGDLDVVCASPERFIKKTGEHLISQPIKGTIRRGSNDKEDEILRKQLAQSIKDRSENVMIVDLVRNDLSRFAKRGSVTVEELFGLRTFDTLHHLISTVACDVDADTHFVDILKSTFPMGSMTGAPKLSAMKLIDSHEQSARGLYSGSIGFIDPEGNFDFNVVIRSLIYHRGKQFLSCSAGGAITALSDPEQEYNESLLKAEAMKRSLETL